jgi:C1A family cysteine protease
MVSLMLQGNARRLIASVLLSSLATGLAACGMATLPNAGVTGSAALSTSSRVEAVSAGGHRFGLKFDPQAPIVRFVAGDINRSRPAAVDLRAKMAPIQDQGHIGACTGFAGSGLAMFRARQHGDNTPLSPGFIYLMDLKSEGNLGQDAGATITTAVNVLKQYGDSADTLHPYLAVPDHDDATKLAKYLSGLPSAAAMQDAATRRITSATSVKDIIGFKDAIAQGKPVIFGIRVYKSFESPDAAKTGIIPVPAAGEPLLGGHAILAVGYDDAKQQVIFRNSWSTGWGDKGYGYMPYGYFKKSLVSDAWSTN